MMTPFEQPSVADQAAHFLQSGIDQCRAEHWHDAIGLLEQAEALNAGNPIAHYFLGMANNGLQQYAMAEEHLALTVAVRPDAYDAFLQLGLAQSGRLEHERAVTSFQHVLALHPGHTEAYFFLAQAYTALGRTAEAIASYQAAIERHPGFLQAFYNLGLIYNNLRHGQDEAERCFLTAVRLAPSCAEAWSMLGQLAYNAGRNEDAIGFLTKAEALIPGSRRKTIHNLALVHHRAGNRQQALQLFQETLNQPGAEQEGWGPQRIRIEVSSRCNLRCRHCPTGTSYQRLERSLMDLSLFERLLNQLKAVRNLSECVMYLGGEPLLHPELPAMIQRVKEELPRVKVMFNSNGMLLTEEVCRQLHGCGVDHIEISIDGRTPEENDAIRRGGRYLTVRDNLRTLLAHRPPGCRVTIANTVPRRKGDPDIPQMPDFLCADFPGVPCQTTYAMQWPGLVPTKGSLFDGESSCQTGIPQQFCKKPFTEMAVRANGDLVLCCYDLASEKVMGNIKETSLLTVWHSLPYGELRTRVAENQQAELPGLCRKCVIYTGAVPLVANPESA